MELLIAGGTSFVGRAIAHAAVARGHEVTVINRGRTPSDLPASVTHLVGDRHGDLSALEGRSFDATVDTIAYRPSDVEALARALAGRGGHHLQISSISAYADGAPRRATEADLVLAAPPTDLDAAITNATYGPLKAAAEGAAHSAFGEGTTIVRPTFIVGSHDPTNRFAALVDRVRLGGRVLVPADEATTVQWIDARDLAAFALTLLEGALPGAFHVAGPADPPTYDGLVEAIATLVAPAGTTLVRVPGQALLDAGVDHATFPLWAGPEGDPVLDLDPVNAIRAGLSLAPLADTVADTTAWLGEPTWRAPMLADDDEARLVELLG